MNIIAMYDIPIMGEAYEKDNQKVYQKLKAFLVNAPGYAWIEDYDQTEDGHVAYMAWTGHYNGRAELNKHMSLAKVRLRSLYYKNEWSLPFETFTGQLKWCFLTLAKDDDEAYSQQRQVEKLLEGIKTDNAELMGTKVVIRQTYMNGFDGACAYFLKSVSEIHGDVCKLNIKHHSKKHGIYAVTHEGRGGCGHRCFGSHMAGHFGARGS